MAPEPRSHTIPIPDGHLLTGHVAEWGELLGVLEEQRGLTVLVADPLSGTSALVVAALRQSGRKHVSVDARICADALDLAMEIADQAIAALAPKAHAWWLGDAPPTSTAGLRVWRSLSEQGVEIDGLRLGSGPAAQRLGDALDLTAALADGPMVVAIDHLGNMLANTRVASARQLLGVLRDAGQRNSALDLLLVDQPRGPITEALGDPAHPMYRAGERLRIRRPTPNRIVKDLSITRPLVSAQPELLQAAAELAAGAPPLTWQIIEMAPNEGDNAARAAAGWEAVKRANAVSVRQEWDLLRRVHPAAQTLIAAISLSLPPHSLPAASKTVDDGLNRLRDVGLAWQPAERTWAVADPILAAYAREHAPPWTLRRKAYARAKAARHDREVSKATP